MPEPRCASPRRLRWAFAEGGCNLLHRRRHEKTCVAAELVAPLGHTVYINWIFQEIESCQLTRSLNEGALLSGEVNSGDTHAVLADRCLNSRQKDSFFVRKNLNFVTNQALVAHDDDVGRRQRQHLEISIAVVSQSALVGVQLFSGVELTAHSGFPAVDDLQLVVSQHVARKVAGECLRCLKNESLTVEDCLEQFLDEFTCAFYNFFLHFNLPF